MVSDRTSALLVQAAVEGVIDFQRAKPYDAKWHLHVQLMMDGLSRANSRALRTHLLRQAAMVLTSERLKDDARDEVGQRVSDLYFDIHETYYPAEKDLRITHEKAVIKDEISGWESRFGQLGSKEMKKKLDNFAAAMEAQRQDTFKKQTQAATSQLGYVGQEMGLGQGITHPGKGRRG